MIDPKKLGIAFAIVLVGVGLVLLTMTVRNEGCLPWQERVSVGDGVFGPQDDFSACR